MPQLLEAGSSLISGMTGMGKTFFDDWKVRLSYQYDRPCTFIDPKGTAYWRHLAYLCAHPQGQEFYQQNKHRIFFLNPATTADHLLAFNPIAPMDDFFLANPDKIALVASSLVSHIKKQIGWDLGMANRMEAIMLASISLLVANGNHTLDEIPLLYQTSYSPGVDGKMHADVCNAYTRRLMENCQHPSRWFWDYQWGNWSVAERKEWVNSTQNQIFRYLYDERCLLTCCAAATARLDFRKVIRDRCWLFVNLAYPYLTPTVTTLLGNLIISRLFYAAVQAETHQDYRLILDEAPFFNTGPVEMILDTAREYKFWLTQIVQSLNQLLRTPSGYEDRKLLESTLLNTRYFWIFRSNSDAEEYAKQIFPLTGEYPMGIEIDQNRRKLMGLQKRQVYFWDKETGVQLWWTPEVDEVKIDPARLAFFEAEHLRLTGTPIFEIRREIRERHERILAQIRGNVPETRTTNQRAIPMFQPGGRK